LLLVVRLESTLYSLERIPGQPQVVQLNRLLFERFYFSERDDRVQKEEERMGGLAEGRVALITGGAKGIGRATAQLFAEEGARAVAIVDLDDEAGHEAVELVEKAGAESIYLHVDVTKAKETERMVADTVAAFGRLDSAYNNAGIVGAKVRFHQWPEDIFDRVIGVDLKAVFLSMKYEITQMLQQGGGQIVNAASAVGIQGAAGFAGYVAAKHGVVGLSRTAGIEYLNDGIRVNAICTGMTRTTIGKSHELRDDTSLPATPGSSGRMADPREIAEAVVWLCSDRASFVSATPFSVDGGQVH
jgi:NAD(P)-dependent dehydrogenase (short-subunit alcohol dehydrogenase family)